MWFQLLRIPKKKRKHNIKKFKNDIDYDVLKNPNVSYCEDDNELHYNFDPRLIVKYLVNDDNEPTQLYYYAQGDDLSITGSEMFDKVEIDNVEVNISDLDTARGTYLLSAGEHVAKYTLKDPTLLGLVINTDLSYNYGATFAQCISVSEVIIPNSITTMGISTFVLCAGLIKVTIGNNLTSIGEEAFSMCTSLTSITIPDSVTTIGQYAFNQCTGLTSVTIGNSVTTIGDGTFYQCSGLTSITIPNSVTSIGKSVFSGCTNLTNITIGNNVTTIGENVFNHCSGLTSITIPNGVTSIGVGAFAYCSSLTNITSLAATAPTINNTSFRNVKSGGTLYVPTGSTGYDIWMGTGDDYLGKYSWTKVEQ